MILSIPLKENIIAFDFKTDLDSRTFGFRFDFNKRTGLWRFNIADAQGTDLLVGIPLMVNIDLIGIYQHNADLPQGVLFAVNLEDEFVDPGVNDLNKTVLLLYDDLEETLA